MNSFSENTLAWLTAHGCGTAVKDGVMKDYAAVMRCFQDAFPGDGIWSDGSRAYLAALTNCLSMMNEMLYLEFRAMGDLFRRFVSRYISLVPADDPVWREALILGDSLSLVDPSQLFRQPHKN